MCTTADFNNKFVIYVYIILMLMKYDYAKSAIGIFMHSLVVYYHYMAFKKHKNKM